MNPDFDVDRAVKSDPTLSAYSRKGKAGEHFALAIATARQVCEDAGLNGHVDDDGRLHFTPEQMAVAARHTREDVAATLTLQLAVLARLDRNRNYMVVIIAMLIFIASQLR